MTITAGMVKELREKTGVGMMECKKALEENTGDLEKAILWLRERGLSRAAKKADRIAAEGIVKVAIAPDAHTGVVVEFNCETDFVSKNEDFAKFADEVAQIALKGKIRDIEELKVQKLGDETVEGRLSTLISKLGENMKIRRLGLLSTSKGAVSGYTHMGGKIGSLILLEGAEGQEVQDLGKDLAMHAAAAGPRYLKSEEVDAGEIETEKELGRKKLAEEGPRGSDQQVL